MGYCGCRTLVGYDPAGRTGVTLKCKSWPCEDCAPVRKKGLMALAARGAPNTILSLTTRRKDGLSVYQAARIISAAWTKLRKRAVRRFGFAPPEFLAVFEAHQSGWPHLHILMRSVFIPWKWLRDTWEELTGSPGVDIRRVNSAAHAAFYVAKYVGKEPGKFGTCKRYWTSPKYDLEKYKRERPVADSATKWEVQQGHIKPIVAAWELSGMNVTWQSIYEARAEHPS